MSFDPQAEFKLIFERWHEANLAQNVDELMALYTQDATFESPAVAVTLGGNGLLVGRDKIYSYFEKFYAGGVANKGWWRSGKFFVNGQAMTWEYPRNSPSGDQNDIVEYIDVENGLIAGHRVYWGWYGLKTLLESKPDFGRS